LNSFGKKSRKMRQSGGKEEINVLFSISSLNFLKEQKIKKNFVKLTEKCEIEEK